MPRKSNFNFSHKTDHFGLSVGMSRDQRKLIVKSFNEVLDSFDEDHEFSKSQVLELVIDKLYAKNLITSEQTAFFAGFFLSHFIEENRAHHDTKKLLKRVAMKFAKDLNDRGVNLKDLPLEDIIDKAHEDSDFCTCDGDEDGNEIATSDLERLLNSDPKEFISKKKLLKHLDEDKDEF